MTTTVLEPAVVPQTAPAVPDVIEVVVGLRHIEMGHSDDNNNCAIEWALIEQGFPGSVVGPYRMWLDDDDDYGFVLPDHVQDWIRRFDNEEQVEPERFLIPRKPAA